MYYIKKQYQKIYIIRLNDYIFNTKFLLWNLTVILNKSKKKGHYSQLEIFSQWGNLCQFGIKLKKKKITGCEEISLSLVCIIYMFPFIKPCTTKRKFLMRFNGLKLYWNNNLIPQLAPPFDHTRAARYSPVNLSRT